MSKPPSQTLPVTVDSELQPHEHRRTPRRRFLTGFFVAIGIWALFKTVHRREHKIHWHGADNWAIAANMVLDGCVAPSNSVDATFEIPLSPATLSHYGSSSSLSGILDITASSHLNDTAKITVHALRGADTKACLVAGAEGEIGVGLFVQQGFMDGSRGFGQNQRRSSPGKTPLELKGIVADLPNFSLNVRNLKESCDFGSAIFRTSNAPINVKSLAAGHARLSTFNGLITIESLKSPDLVLETSNAGISGTFNTSGTLQLTSSNAPIKVTINLESIDPTRPTSVFMRTSNARIAAKLHLLTVGHGRGGPFIVSGTTSNGALDLSVPTSPVGNELSLTARTSNEPAAVRLHGAYEGTFSVATSNFGSQVRRVDEEGDGRQVEYEGVGSGRGETMGYVYAEERNRELGNVEVRTTNTPAVLWV
ncbi:hypothetical protein DFH08DRAFT_963201 [Mycena albidolilacea]|uniref:Uncharacterized protein n=1 Tax=Mycena albidolilacea TaxID=1033008 RepID=A0AAD6ZW31_9AGAR|nr:hypothetical protein DFH08DRAFT_963201 [Mycena albidolilacea]